MVSVPENRTGKTVKQLNGYLAYIPHELCPGGPPNLNYDHEIVSLLSEADRALGELNGITKILYSSDLFVAFYVRKEALLSSQIEGTQCSLDEVLQADKRSGEMKPVDEVVNYISAMNYGLERVKELPISLRLIKEIHKILLEDVRGRDKNPGEFKRYQNWVGSPGCSLEQAAYVAPPPEETLRLMGDLEKYYYSGPNLPALVKAAILHSHFETIHPFVDGNGRLGRLLITFFLCKQNVLDRSLLYLSLFFKEHKDEYYELLMRVRTKGDWEEWIKFFLRGVRSTSQEAGLTARELVSLRETHRAIIDQKLSRMAYAQRLYEIVTETPLISIATVAKKHLIPFPTVQRTAEALRQLGIIELSADRYGQIIRFEACLKILRRGT